MRNITMGGMMQMRRFGWMLHNQEKETPLKWCTAGENKIWSIHNDMYEFEKLDLSWMDLDYLYNHGFGLSAQHSNHVENANIIFFLKKDNGWLVELHCGS